MFFGPSRYVSFGALGGGSPWIALARDAWGLGWVVAFLAIVNSGFANANAGTLATTRTWYAMARIGVLPGALARTHPRWKSPYVGVLVQFIATLAVGLPLALHYGPTTVFVLLATVLSAVMIVIYVVFNLSCLLFYARRARAEFNWLLHGVIPMLGILVFLPAWFTAMGLWGSVLKWVTPLRYPSSLTGPIIGTWFAIGVVVLGTCTPGIRGDCRRRAGCSSSPTRSRPPSQSASRREPGFSAGRRRLPVGRRAAVLLGEHGPATSG